MSDYNELVKALRHCMTKEDGITICEPCPYYGNGIECENVLHTDAAAAIEALQTENMDLLAEVQDSEMRVENLAGELAAEEDGRKLEQKRGEWSHVERVDRSWETDEIFGFVVQCSICGNKTIGASLYCPVCGAKMEVQE